MIDPRIVIVPLGPADRAEEIAARAARRGFAHVLGSRGHDGSTLVREGGGYRDASGSEAVPLVEIRDPHDLDPVLVRLRAGRAVAVRWREERVIPLETLVAARTRPGTLWVVTDRPPEVPGSLGALEHGADRVLVEIDDPARLDELEAILEREPTALVWDRATIRRVVSAGLGDRVLVDTTSMLAAEEGMLLGSQAAILVHVASEARGSRYTRPRPFRVNAGSAHLYTLLPNGETRYLSELESGEAVLVARPQGAARSVRIGRIKIERRPLTLVELERDGRRYTVFLQEAETVRLSTAAGAVPTTELRVGTDVPVAVLPQGRHLGIAVDETIEER